jgi:hypothetical protein
MFTGLAAGTYTIRVNREEGCGTTQTQVVTEPTLPHSNGFITPFCACAANNGVNVYCNSDRGAGSGTAQYTYSINGTNYFTSNPASSN